MTELIPSGNDIHQVGDEPPYFPDNLRPADEVGLVALGGTLSVDIVLEAYRKGIFPWTGKDPIPWHAPDPRMLLMPKQLRRSRSLRKLERQALHEVTYDTAFREIMHACATAPPRDFDGTWITPNMFEVYGDLFKLGYAHSVEVRRDGALVGGLYGIALGRVFFGESMVSLEPNASKLALSALCRRLEKRGYHFIDCQQATWHLMSLGACVAYHEVFMIALDRALAEETELGPWTA